MPPKKDAKKGAAVKELDPSLYVRKPVELEDIPIDTSVIEQLAGRIANIDTLFPVWDSAAIAEEKWAEPIAADTAKAIKYPQNLGVTGDVNLIKFFNLEPTEVAVDPKAKKEAKKDPKKGAVEAPVALTETLADEHGRSLPVVFKPKSPESAETQPEVTTEDNSHLEFDMPRSFLRSYTEEQQARLSQQEALAAASTNPESEAPVPAKEEPKGGEIDPFLCGAYRVIQRFTPTIVKAHVNLAVVTEAVAGAAEGIEEERHIIQDTFLWRAIHPQLPNGKPVYNPAGKYCVRLYLCGKWRRVYVDDSVPVTADGAPALACSADTLELWPLLLAKAIYSVYSACGYTEVVPDAMQQPDEWVCDVPSTAVGEEPQPRPEALCKPQCAAQFTSFVVHILTGWQPRAPISLRRLFTQELTRSTKLLQTLAIEGVSTIDEDDVVRDRDEPTGSDLVAAARGTNTRSSIDFSMIRANVAGEVALLMGDEAVSERDGGPSYDDYQDNDEEDYGMQNIAEGSHEVSVAEDGTTTVIEPADDGVVRRTKKQFKAEYLRRKNYRDVVVAKIVERERRIAKISEALLAMLTEAFFVCYFDPETQTPRTLPILGVSYPASHKTHLLQVHLLVHWRTAAPKPTPFTPNPTPEDPETEEVRGVDAGPLPLTTPLEYEWITIQQLVDLNAFLVGMDTKMLTPFDTTFTSPWVPLSSLPVSGGPPRTATASGEKDKAKEKPKGKDAKAVVEAPVVEEFFADPGTLPVTLLRLDTSEFYVEKTEEEQQSFKAPQMARQISSLSVSGKLLPLKPEIRQKLRKGALSEAEATLKDEQAEVTKSIRNISIDEDDDSVGFEDSPVRKRLMPVADFLHFTVMIHADVVLEYKDELSNAPPGMQPPLAEDEALLAPRKPKRMLPSDITLVLQEVRTDKVDPLMFVMEMKDFAYLPVVSKSFAISTKRLPQDRSQPLVFWMRLFSRSSVYMQISSEVGVAVGPAEQIWAGIGKSVFFKEGYSEATRNQTQQLVFRLPLVCDRPAKKSPDGTEESATALSSPSRRERVATGMTFLHVTDRSIDRFVSLGLLPVDRSKALVPLPRTQGNVVEFSTNPDDATVLLGRTFPSALFDKKAHSVPAFSWKLLVLSDDPIREPVKPINEEMVTQRYTGKFIANNKNALFRDIYTIDKLSFPLAFRLTTSHSRPVTGSLLHQEHNKTTEHNAFAGMASEGARKALRSALTIKGKRKEVCIVVRLYRAADMKLVAEYRGRESVICYLQSLEQFLPDGETFDVAAAVAAAAEAKANAGGKGAKAPPKPAKGAPVPTTSDNVDVLVECTLDEEVMLIGEDWQSRYPHVYDGLYPDVSLSATAAASEAHEALASPSPEKGGKKGEVEAEDPVAKNIQVIQAQQKCLGIAPPSDILIKWQLDVMAGKVVNISHDIRALEKEIAIKNSWEEGSAGRSDKSAAALRYYQERRAAMKKQLEDANLSNTPTEEQKESAPAVVEATATSAPAASEDKYASVRHLTPVMVESLVTALGADVELAKRRYTVLNNIPKSAGVVDILQKDPDDKRISFIKPRNTSDAQREADILAQMLSQRAAEGSRGEARFQDIADRFVKLNTECRQEAKERVEAIAKEANADAVALGALWELREKYRLSVEARNASVNYLLKRAADAKVVARAAEKKAADEAAAAAEKLRKEEEKKAAKQKKK